MRGNTFIFGFNVIELGNTLNPVIDVGTYTLIEAEIFQVIMETLQLV
jgi:hypothetical protein